jgi:hypothetical protein
MRTNVAIGIKRWVKALFALALLAPALAFALPTYLRSTVGPPWGETTNEAAMDTVFGAGNWTDERYETVDVGTLLSAATSFIYMEGGDDNADELNAFLTANAAAIASWVSAGGHLFINAAPNEGGNIDFGFGVTLNYNGGSSESDNASAVSAAHPIFNGPFTPVGTSFTGSAFSHAYLTGPLTAVIRDDSSRTVFGTVSSGAGLVGFGGMTTDNFQDPQPQAHNLRENIIAFLAGAGGGGGLVAVPTLQTGALVALAALLGIAALVVSRRRRI